MRNLQVKLLVALFATAVLLSCKKDPDNVIVPVEKPVKLVKEVSSSATDFITFEYDADGNVTKHISQWQNGNGGLNKLTNVYAYSGGKLLQFSNEAGRALFSYKNGVIEKSDNYAINGRKISTIFYHFRNGKLDSLIEQNANPLPDDVKETKISYQYYSNGNVSRIDFAYRKEFTDPFTITSSKVYVEYDNKKNPEPDGVLGFYLPGMLLQINNPIKVNVLNANGTVDGYSRYEYSYNTEGFPVMRKHIIAVGNTEQAPVPFQYTY